MARRRGCDDERVEGLPEERVDGARCFDAELRRDSVRAVCVGVGDPERDVVERTERPRVLDPDPADTNQADVR
jgi:hypothetical protein